MLKLPVFIVILLINMLSADALEIFVSPTGKDTNNGRSSAAALRTIQEGINKALPGDTVYISPGVYRETVVFPRSGTAGKVISVLPYQGGKVTVTGCDPVSGWTPYPAKQGAWKAEMPWTCGIGRNQIFDKGSVLIEARYPNKPSGGWGMYVAGLSPLWPTFGEFSIPDPNNAPNKVTSPLLKNLPADYWKGAIYYGVHYEAWCAQTGIVESSKGNELTIEDRTNTWWFPYPGSNYSPEEGHGMIVGHMNALDQAGEWHWQEGKLYLISPDDRKPVSVEAKRRQIAFDLSNREYIRIKGITVRAASMRLDGSSNCTVDGCDLAYISHFTRQYAMGQIEKGRDTIRSGETGIYVSGHDNSFLNCSIRFSAGAGFHLRGYHHTIHNCLIDEVDYTAHYLNAITDAVDDYADYEGQLVGGHVITFNTMRNAGRHMFNISGNGTSTASRNRGPMDYMGTLFAHNHLYNGMLLTKDAGMITGYHCGAGTLNDLNTQIAYNVMHDSWDIFGMRINALGIVYLDEGTCYATVRNNLLWAAPGTLQRGFWYNTTCVGVKESDNVFLTDFNRTSAQLKATDFPNSKPFRFGNDFVHPPALPLWPQLNTKEIKTPASAVSLQNDSTIDLGTVNFDRGYQSAQMRFTGKNIDLNTDHSARQAPRHKKATDPLVLESSVNDGKSTDVATQWTFIHNVKNGAWLRFNNVPFGKGYKRFKVIYGCVENGARSLEAHVDSLDGPLAATATLQKTDRDRGGYIQLYSTAIMDVNPEITGTHDVYLLFKSADKKTVGEFEYFRFEGYRGDIELQKNEARIELRCDTPTGDILGVFYPLSGQRTGPTTTLVTGLQSLKGAHKLYAVVRTSAVGDIGGFDAVRLQRSAQPQSMSAIGQPPLKNTKGGWLFPAATNRPIAHPADRYGHVSAPKMLNLIRSPKAATGLYLPRNGMELWLDAADGKTIVKSENGHISRWLDRSGKKRDAVQSDIALQPFYKAIGINGKPAILFDENRSTRMIIPDLAEGKMNATIFAVISNPEGGSEVNHDPRILTASASTEMDYISGLGACVQGMETGGPRQMQWVFMNRWAQNVHLGCFSPMYQTYFNGIIAEIMVYNRTLNGAEQLRVQTYLYSKWGVK